MRNAPLENKFYVIIILHKNPAVVAKGVKQQQCSDTVAMFCSRWIEACLGRLYPLSACFRFIWPLLQQSCIISIGKLKGNLLLDILLGLVIKMESRYTWDCYFPKGGRYITNPICKNWAGEEMYQETQELEWLCIIT